MAVYAKEELEDALRAIVSTIGKCEKVSPKLKENSAQQTLLKRRIKALQISVDLIERELADLLEEENKQKMEFNPSNKVVQLCIQGMNMEDSGKPEEAGRIFFRAWNEAENDFEKYLAAYYLARRQENVADKLKWLETALEFAIKANSDAVRGAFSGLYVKIAECYENLGDADNVKKNYESASASKYEISDEGPFYHGTRADLQIGDLLTAGFNSNYQAEIVMNHIYFTAVISGAGLAAALARGDGRERVYIVEPTGKFENDPNVTDKKFPGNPTRSYRTESPLKIVGEATDWARITPEELQKWREKLANGKGEIIN